MFGRSWSLWLWSFCVALAVNPARADTVVMHDGTMYYGEVIEETEAEVVMKTKVANIVTTVRLKRAEIQSIDRPNFGVREGFFEEKEKKAGDAEPTVDASSYLLIPIKGTIGVEATADGVEQALKDAKERSIRHIVFELDTPGGYVQDAEKMADLIEAHRASAPADSPVKFHAYIRNALSAGIWVVFSCDEVCWAEGASAGAAVTFSKDRTTGAAEVDAKMNSAFAAKVAAIAEKHRHSPHFVRAMMVPEAKVYSWRDGRGNAVISGTAPVDKSAITEFRVLDDQGSILTLSASDAAAVGFGKVVPAGPEGLGAVNSVPDWKSAGDAGEKAMAQAAKTRQRELEQAGKDIETIRGIEKEFRLIIGKIDGMITAANSADPLQEQYTVDSSGNFTASSRAAWKANCDRAIDLWDEVLNSIDDLQRLDGRHKRLGGDGLLDKAGKKWVVGEIRDKAKWLREKRGATRP